jgi:Secretion system C-terminal sorting domain
MRIITTLIIVQIAFCAYGQTISQQVFASAGKGSAAFDYTIGEPITLPLQNTRTLITQGFHQPEFVVVSTENLFSNYNISLFPNPCAHFLSIQTDVTEQINVEIIDVNGKSLIVQNNINVNNPISVESISAGVYFAIFRNMKNEMIAKSKFIKITD